MIVGLILDIVLICLYIGFAIYVYCKNKKQEKDIYEFKTGMNKGYLIFSIVFDSIALILIAISIALYFENTPEGVWVCFGMALFIGVLSNVILYDNILDYEAIGSGWTGLVPKKYRETSIRIVNDVKDGMNRYFRGQALVAFLVGVLFSIGFVIIDFPLAIGFGLFIGLLNMVPYLQLIALVPTVLLALLKAADTGENFWWILACALIVFCVVQVIQDGFIVPKVMGKITGLNPAIILLSLSIWGALMGVVGMIIALPCTTILLSYYKRYIKKQEESLEQNTEAF